MSEEQNKRLYTHYNSLIAGSAKTANTVRNELIVSDAKRHLADIVEKNPYLTEVPEEPKETKPKKGK